MFYNIREEPTTQRDTRQKNKSFVPLGDNILEQEEINTDD